jgi:hypothetical protein
MMRTMSDWKFDEQDFDSIETKRTNLKSENKLELRFSFGYMSLWKTLDFNKYKGDKSYDEVQEEIDVTMTKFLILFFQKIFNDNDIKINEEEGSNTLEGWVNELYGDNTFDMTKWTDEWEYYFDVFKNNPTIHHFICDWITFQTDEQMDTIGNSILNDKECPMITVVNGYWENMKNVCLSENGNSEMVEEGFNEFYETLTQGYSSKQKYIPPKEMN